MIKEDASDPEARGIDQLLAIIARLRAPGGCPWDREQTHASLRGGLLEEAYEVVSAIDAADDENLREELGDLLLQSVFHAQIAAEEGRFTFDDVARGIAEKLVRRHPHVFGDAHCADSAAVLVKWEEIKRGEKSGPAADSVLAGIPRGLTALMRAEKVQRKVAKVGFDWDAAQPVIAKIREELDEVEAALASADRTALEHEIGDLLFSVVNLARQLKIDAEVALHRATEKFIGRFQAVESLARSRGIALEKLTLAELDGLWEEVKRGVARRRNRPSQNRASHHTHPPCG
jgi:MazG family protein